MNVLVACEFSGKVRDAFLRRGHNAYSCDILPTESHGPHLQGDVLDWLDMGWDLMVAFPPCTHIAVSGAAWFKKKKKRQRKALEFFLAMMNAPIPRIAIENPVGVASSRIRKCDQIIQPWQFGQEFQKTTCLWLKNLPKLQPTKIVSKGEFTVNKDGKKRATWFEKARSGNHNHERSRTFDGIAEAMADQWGEPFRPKGLGLRDQIPWKLKGTEE